MGPQVKVFSDASTASLFARLFCRCTFLTSCFLSAAGYLDAAALSAFTHHLYDPGFLARSLLLGHDVLRQNHAAEQGTHAGAGRGSDLHHGRPVHNGPLLLQVPPDQPPPGESRRLFCQQAPAHCCKHATEDRLCWSRPVTLYKIKFWWPTQQHHVSYVTFTSQLYLLNIQMKRLKVLC